MSGHSKWANTKYRKASQDNKREKIFTKIIRELVIASHIGGSNLAANPRLRAAVSKALSKNMTRNTLNRAIARGIGNSENINMETIIYEGYGPEGIAIMVRCLSDNRNRTTAEIRNAFNKFGGKLGTHGSVSFLFKKKGIISFFNNNEDFIIEKALEAGAEDVIVRNDSTIDVYTEWKKMGIIYDTLEKVGLKADNTKISMVPFNKIDINQETSQKLFRFIEILKDCNDVQEIFHNGKTYNKVISTF